MTVSAISHSAAIEAVIGTVPTAVGGGRLNTSAGWLIRQEPSVKSLVVRPVTQIRDEGSGKVFTIGTRYARKLEFVTGLSVLCVLCIRGLGESAHDQENDLPLADQTARRRFVALRKVDEKGEPPNECVQP